MAEPCSKEFLGAILKDLQSFICGIEVIQQDTTTNGKPLQELDLEERHEKAEFGKRHTLTLIWMMKHMGLAILYEIGRLFNKPQLFPVNEETQGEFKETIRGAIDILKRLLALSEDYSLFHRELSRISEQAPKISNSPTDLTLHDKKDTSSWRYFLCPVNKSQSTQELTSLVSETDSFDVSASADAMVVPMGGLRLLEEWSANIEALNAEISPVRQSRNFLASANTLNRMFLAPHQIS